MKKIALIAAAVILASLVLASGAFAEKKPEFTLKLGHLANTEHTWHKGSLKFAELVDQKTDGRVKVQVFPNEQLGKEMEVIGNIQSGIVDMLITGESMMNWAPLCGLIAVPYMIRDSDHMEKIVEGEVGQAIEKEVIEKVRLRPVAWFERGARNLTSNREIRKPEDLNGLKVRVPNVPLFVATWEALGAKPTPMAFSEVFTSLQQGIIDGQENPLSIIWASRLYEVQKYLSLTGHVYSPVVIMISDAFYNSLPEDLQKIVVEAFEEVRPVARKMVEDQETELVEQLREKGMEVNTVEPEAFQAKMGGVYDDFVKNVGKEAQEFIDRIKEVR